ncbi:unnamed protein product [Cylindrotheca closterium]|uniref:Uncharacterized protein n=1 Tax=Cylindrotheca closterium TaxID=2856 RepID=A0AAD2FDZ1_9STRA|nr:unnamed protein product [Cylindrotheca closterium]
MSEKDMKLGGAAATKFASKNSYDGAASATYKSTDQVREYYLSEMERLKEAKEVEQSNTSTTNEASGTSVSSSNVPDFWASRQRERDLQAKQMGVFARNATTMPQQQNQSVPSSSPVSVMASATSSTTGASSGSSLSPEVALVQIATNTLETMAAAMESNSQTKIPMSERAAFANAMKRAMAALAKQSS